jgi:signal transduction histidine kinase
MPAMAAEHAGPNSLRQLLAATLSVSSDLDLTSVLQRIVEGAVNLVGARYGALGVLDEAGTGLMEFVTVGVDDDTRAAIGALPKGLGLLGALITDAHPLRVAHLSEYPGRSGFPPNHPPMTSFLGVPVRVRDQVFGNLYLTDKTNGEVFTDVDEELALGLAASAGVAIDNARLFDEVRRREAALEAMHNVASALLAGAEPKDTLRLVARQARALARADIATFALPDPDGDTLVMDVCEGEAGTDLTGVRFARAGSVSGAVLASGQAAVIEDLSTDPRRVQPQVQLGEIGPAIFIALTVGREPIGTLSVGRRRNAPIFTQSDVDMVQWFATQASMVLEHDRDREQLQRVSLLEDQERIGRDLHDTVIQRLFAIGLSVQATIRLVGDARARERLSIAVDDLDTVVRHIRTVIFDVAPTPEAGSGVRRDVLDVVRDAARALGFEPTVTFEGAVDAQVSQGVAEEVLASLREALSNVARHARATRVDVVVTAHDSQLVVRIADNGIGIAPDDERQAGRGLLNMRARASRLGGSVDVHAAPDGQGTIVVWWVPLPA